MNFRLLIIASLLFSCSILDAQKVVHRKAKTSNSEKVLNIPQHDNLQNAQKQESNIPKFNPKPITLEAKHEQLASFQSLSYKFASDGSRANFIKRNISRTDAQTYKSQDPVAQAFDFLEEASKVMGIEDPKNEFELVYDRKDELGHQHMKMQQVYNNIPVYDGEIIIHGKDGLLSLINGMYFKSPKLNTQAVCIDEQQAQTLIEQHASAYADVVEIANEQLQFIGGKAFTLKKMIKIDAEASKLIYEIEFYPNPMSKYIYLMDAKTGAILHHYSALCGTAGLDGCKHGHKACKHNKTVEIDHKSSASEIRIDKMNGPEIAYSQDLFNITRLINVFEQNGTYFMIDASRNMFDLAASNASGQLTGVVWTFDHLNTSPGGFGSDYSNITTTNNNNWNNKNAVSAHYNAGIAYEYFEDKFNRNSINGQGGNVLSFINVAEQNGQSYDGAFWNGTAMYYGNGGSTFTSPLAKGLDVAGHEMTHGVVQSTANLKYENESGALNESFADVFGAMMDDEDWLIGEDVINTNIYVGGALRNLQNPHNGGNSLYDPGWQPNRYSERYTGSQDNGGVHINSGIVNRAYYLTATANGVGNAKAERIWYRALTQYLVRSSDFLEARYACVKSAEDLYGSTEVNAVKNAFNIVEIGSSGSNDDGVAPILGDLAVNPGNEFMVLSEDDQKNLHLLSSGGIMKISDNDPLSNPSVSDNGDYIVYVGMDNHIYRYNRQPGTEDQLSGYPVWANCAISKDGTRIAAVTNEVENIIYVFDLLTGANNAFELYNPTFTSGATTGDVLFADVLEWDHSGEFVMYDAFNRNENSQGTQIDYWDIGFIEVWDNSTNNFANGNIEKVFNSLPENSGVGNPTFSKNSPYIIAFDFLDLLNDNYGLFATNLETGETNALFTNQFLNYPNYSVDDTQLTFDAVDNAGARVLGVFDMDGDKITPAGNPMIFINEFKWGVWFADGERDLQVDIDADHLGLEQLSVWPNPVTDHLNIQIQSKEGGQIRMSILDINGRLIKQKQVDISLVKESHRFELEGLSAGTYQLLLSYKGNTASTLIVKL